MLAAGTAIAIIARIATGNRFRTIHTGFGDGMVFYRSRIATIIRQEAVETRDHDNAIATVIIICRRYSHYRYSDTQAYETHTHRNLTLDNYHHSYSYGQYRNNSSAMNDPLIATTHEHHTHASAWWESFHPRSPHRHQCEERHSYKYSLLLRIPSLVC